MRIVSVREQPGIAQAAISYFQERWATPESAPVYEDCIMSSLTASAPLPHWYLLLDGDRIAGGAGLITNDFISRMDLYPWLCALYIEPEYRGRALGALLLERAKSDAAAGGFEKLYLCTDHIGYYEHYGFRYLGQGHHPWGETSRVYVSKTGA